ncbi:DNA-binding transcriptional regulator [Camelimonas fluminis]|uniref:Helix-turn-helix transcriptional regulator n=1 Tax=Camelimonas fluminis TaxID=1576911 RepID=A0ABV7UCV9_9HYPH|nr:YafY family protein [Camelimonas fluminis]GHE46569.1 DNA-binding transcriptional regulator [Camelimonas fluminis]
MRRADRLLELTGYLQEGGVVTAATLAARLEVSVRTVYRDIAALQAQGYPVDGEAGSGYLLRAPVRLAPLAFSHDQLEALALGLAYVEQVGDAALRLAARDARVKIDLTWCEDDPGRRLGARPMRAVQRPERRAPTWTADLRRAVRQRRTVEFDYMAASGAASRRMVRPLALSAFSDGWLLAAWCEMRGAHRLFRLDRISALIVGEREFPDEPDKGLAAWLAGREDRPPRL